MPGLQLHIKALYKPQWSGIVIKSSDPPTKQRVDITNLRGSIDPGVLQERLPNGEHLAVSFQNNCVVLQPNFSIKKNGNIVRRDESIVIPQKSGFIRLSIHGIVYVANVI